MDLSTDVDLDRTAVIQKLIDTKRAQTYLEIGVNRGRCFLKIKAPYKIAVDPRFLIPAKKKIRYFLKNPSNLNNHYFEQTSDRFFDSEQALLKRKPLDIAFIDGLHTYEQSLKDVVNTLKFLKDDGVIVVHDCNPLTEAAAYPAESLEHAEGLNVDGWENDWSGDVWKAIVALRASREDLNVFVLDCDHGLGIITRSSPESRLNFTEEQVAGLSYKDFAENRDEFLNLKDPAFLQEFMRNLA